MLQGLRVKLPRRLGGYFHNDADHRDFVAIGTAAGEALNPRVPWICLHLSNLSALTIVTFYTELSCFGSRSCQVTI